MEHLIANISGEPRTEYLNGKEHLVVPMVLIVPGVLNGSKGPLFYPSDELSKDPSVWNNVPMVVYHPMHDGKAISARQPSVLNKSFVGCVFNAKFDGKLVAEGWFDVERTRRVDSRILRSLESHNPIELSTGLRTEEDPTPGVFNSVKYDAVARNYVPDHLAILPDQKGACSLKDGCGVLINEKSAGDIHKELSTQLSSDAFGPPEKERYVVEVFSDYFILYRDGKLWRMNYKVENDVLTILDAKPVEVQLVTSYIPIMENDIMAKLNQAKRKEIIDDLVANCDCWEEDDRETLNAFSDAKLTAVSEQSVQYRQRAQVANAAAKGFAAGNTEWSYDEKKGEFVANVKTQTKEEWWAAAPDDIKEVVANAKASEQKSKDAAIEIITANEANTFTEEELQSMKLPQLEKLAALAEKQPVSNYAGAAGGTSKTQQPEKIEPLMPPVMDFSKE